MSNLDASENQPITQMLHDWASGNAMAQNALVEEIYQQLYQIACRNLMSESKPSLDATELVNEAWIRISEGQHEFTSRRHFFAFAALQMRRLLVDIARSAHARQNHAVTLNSLIIDPAHQPSTVTALANALDHLEKLDPRKLQTFALVEMAGFTAAQTAEIMDISIATIQRDLRFTRVWLSSRMS